MALNFSQVYQELLTSEAHVYFNSLHNQLKFLKFSRVYQELLTTEAHVYFNSIHNQLKFLKSIQLQHFSSHKFLENQPLSQSHPRKYNAREKIK